MMISKHATITSEIADMRVCHVWGGPPSSHQSMRYKRLPYDDDHTLPAGAGELAMTRTEPFAVLAPSLDQRRTPFEHLTVFEILGRPASFRTEAPCHTRR
jgi:hypothetical protein